MFLGVDCLPWIAIDLVITKTSDRP